MTTVRKIFHLQAVNGDAGIEIEVEGRKLPAHLEKYWRVEHDGSLRGPENREYVMRNPGCLTKVANALRYLDESYQDCDSEVHETVRAGVHVHINCQELTMTQVYSFITAYLIIEELMVEFCGEHRQGNLFCLRASDAEYLPLFLAKIAKGQNWRALVTDKVRYASINVKSLGTYGSLEFRAMRGTRDLDVIKTWTEMLLNLREFAVKYPSPVEVVGDISRLGPYEFVRMALGQHADLVLNTDEVHSKVWTGVRSAQEVAFAINWELLKEQPDEPKMAQRKVYVEPNPAAPVLDWVKIAEDMKANIENPVFNIKGEF